MKFFRRLLPCILLLTLVACSSGSHDEDLSKKKVSNPNPSPTSDRLSTLEQKLHRFEILLEDYKKCIAQDWEANCAEKAQIVNAFSFEN
jgi:hypothetical protein